MLSPYTKDDFHLLQQWITDADILLQYAGTNFQYPITQQQMDAYAAEHPDRRFYICAADDKPFAFGEIIPQDEHSVRIGRLLIGDPAQRSKGLGLYFVNELLQECKAAFHVSRVDLYVRKENTGALRCYQKAGFEFADEPPYIMMHNGTEMPIYKMSVHI